MTPTEHLIREGLAGLAPRAPADAAAYARVGRAITHRRRQRAAARVASVAAVTLVAVGAVALRSGTEQPSDTMTTPPEATAGRVTFGAASFELPAGWSVTSQDDTSMCVARDGADDAGRCPGLALSQGELVGHEGGPYVDHGEWSWYTGTDAMPCPNQPWRPGDEFDSVVPGEAGMAPIERGTAAVGDRTAVYDKWAAECAISRFTFTPRAWHLTDPELLIVDQLDNPETEAILESFEFAEDGSVDARPGDPEGQGVG